MPCYTVITVEVKNKMIALETMKKFGINESSLITTSTGYKIDLTFSPITEGEFKTEYGMINTEQNARKYYGIKAQIYRGMTENKPTVFIKLRN